MANLNGKIALVTGGSRGLGQGIALVLGEHGCTVYVTGRSTKEDSQHPEWPNATIDKTAQLVTEMGGKGIPIQCDHTDDDQVDGVYERIKEERGYIDILVNVIWGGYENMENFSKPFWDQPNWRIDKMYQTGVRTSYTACRIGAKLMLSRKQGLIINITFWDQDKYLEPVPQDFALTAMGRLVFAMAQELKPHNIASIALSPGFIRNEGMLSQEEIRGEYQRPPVVSQNLPPKTESTQYAGRAVVALACDPNIISRTGQILNIGNLSREYGFTDIDGTQPPPYQIEWTGKP